MCIKEKVKTIHKYTFTQSELIQKLGMKGTICNVEKRNQPFQTTKPLDETKEWEFTTEEGDKNDY